MTRAPSADQIADHKWDLRKHEPTPREIADKLAHIERELIETAIKTEAATKEAMRIIEELMDRLGIPMAKDSADA